MLPVRLTVTFVSLGYALYVMADGQPLSVVLRQIGDAFAEEMFVGRIVQFDEGENGDRRRPARQARRHARAALAGLAVARRAVLLEQRLAALAWRAPFAVRIFYTRAVRFL